MSYPHIVSRVYGQPLVLARARWAGIHGALLPHLRGQIPLPVMERAADAGSRKVEEIITAPAKKKTALPGAPAPQRPAKTIFGQRAKSLMPSISNGLLDPRLYRFAGPGIAALPISGILCKNPSAFDEDCGGVVDVTPIGEAINQALADPEVQVILLDVDSPGGEVTGIPETASAIRAANAQKPVIAFCDASACSGAYWLACAAGEFYATHSACIGSIGVYLALLDESVAMEMEGLKLELFMRGARKAIGLGGRDLTDEDRQYLDEGVQEVYADFTAAVKAYRPQVDASNFEAQVYSGTEAMEQGMIDGVADDYDEVVALISARLAMSPGAAV